MHANIIIFTQKESTLTYSHKQSHISIFIQNKHPHACNSQCYDAEFFVCIDTIPCLLSPWSDWSDCSVTCGKGTRIRQRTLKSPAELGECNEELEQMEKCMLPECRELHRLFLYYTYTHTNITVNSSHT